MCPLADALDGVAVGAAAGFEDARDEIAGVSADVEERHPRVFCRPGEGERGCALGVGVGSREGFDLAREIGHEVARHEVRDGHVCLGLLGSGVGGHVGFAVEMLDFRQGVLGDGAGVGQRGPHEVLHAGGHAGVDDVLALGGLGGFGHGFPVVRYGEDGVGVRDRGRDGGCVVEVGAREGDALGGEGLGVRFAGVPGYGAQSVFG